MISEYVILESIDLLKLYFNLFCFNDYLQNLKSSR